LRPYMSLDQPWCFGLSCRKEGDEKLKAAWRLQKAQQKKHKRRKRGTAAAKAGTAVSVGGRFGGRGVSESGRPTVSVDGSDTAAPTGTRVQSSSPPPPPPDEFSEHHLALQLARRVRGQAAVVG